MQGSLKTPNLLEVPTEIVEIPTEKETEIEIEKKIDLEVGERVKVEAETEAEIVDTANSHGDLLLRMSILSIFYEILIHVGRLLDIAVESDLILQRLLGGRSINQGHLISMSSRYLGLNPFLQLEMRQVQRIVWAMFYLLIHLW